MAEYASLGPLAYVVKFNIIDISTLCHLFSYFSKLICKFSVLFRFMILVNKLSDRHFKLCLELQFLSLTWGSSNWFSPMKSGAPFIIWGSPLSNMSNCSPPAPTKKTKPCNYTTHYKKLWWVVLSVRELMMTICSSWSNSYFFNTVQHVCKVWTLGMHIGMKRLKKQTQYLEGKFKGGEGT